MLSHIYVEYIQSKFNRGNDTRVQYGQTNKVDKVNLTTETNIAHNRAFQILTLNMPVYEKYFIVTY